MGLPPETLRVGIIGAGGIVKDRHLPGLLAIPGVEVTAVANSTIESAKAFCTARLPNARASGDWQEIIDSREIDIVWIGAPPCLHKEPVIASLEAGKHVFCQARMARNLKEAKEMREAAREHPDLVTMLCPPPQGLEIDGFIRDFLAGGSIGQIHQVRLHSLSSAFLDPNVPAHWRQRREINGLNVLTLGIYAEVLQRWFGKMDVLHAEGGVLTPIRQGYEIRTPDFLTVAIEFASGTQGTLQLSGVEPGPSVDTLDVAGRDGRLHLDFSTNVATVVRGARSSPEVLAIPPESRRPWRVEADFVDAVRNPEAPRPAPTFEHGYSYMKVVQKVHDLLDR